ncbi:MAG TPA: NAD(P)/FAD-dependent oxidoreductase [Steroidobacteraceae bacterium]|jgi:L-2-hydroxyglutarate oxidase LhgO|nr:NAD(P)/FAD-dependent oxidoreductase [Steroidobacteraceae bacterium]
MSEKIDCVVIGAGVVGLAVARALARRGRETLVLEAEDAIGTGTSSRNSEVIHAGIYYAPDSAKARLCVAGKQLLYPYCEARGIGHRRCGKLIVAADQEQVRALEKIEATARANGVHDLQWLTAAGAKAMEPALSCVAALLSPSTGIVDSHGFMLALQGDLEDAGGTVAFRAPVRRGRCSPEGILLEAGSDDVIELAARVVVNSAGLNAQQVARQIDGVSEESIPASAYAKGNYYVLQGRAPFQRLIYPVPEPGGLGVHLTLDLAGQARFGPDVEWVEKLDYTVDPTRAEGFYRAIRRYWPGLPDGSLHPGYAGVRPKLSGRGHAAADFLIQGPEAHGIPGLVNLYGIESPGLTAALAIAEQVADAVR